MIEDIWRRKNNLQAYGSLLCSHRDKDSWEYINCPQKGCILYIIVMIAKKIVNDLLKIARRNTRMKKQPTRGDWGKSALSFWSRELSRYLLFSMQKIQFLHLRPEHKENILFQVGYPADITLSSVFGVKENEVTNSIPYWIIISRLTATQLIMLANNQGIAIPENCTKTRDALCKVVMNTYDQ